MAPFDLSSPGPRNEQERQLWEKLDRWFEGLTLRQRLRVTLMMDRGEFTLVPAERLLAMANAMEQADGNEVHL